MDYRRIEVADYYLKNLKDVKEISLPVRKEWAKQVYHLFVIRVNNRDKLQSYLKDNNISSGIHYPISLPKLQAYDYLNQSKENFFANSSDKNLLSLPIFPEMTLGQIEFVTKSIINFYAK